MRGLLVSFDHYRPDRAGFGEVRPVMTALAAGHASLTVMTAANDWFLNDDTPRAMARLHRFCARFAVVRAVGFSMGGYGALLFSGAMAPRDVLLLAPQAGIAPAVVPWEWRWRAARADLAEGVDDLALHLAPGLRGVAVYDPRAARADRLQARLARHLAPGIAVVALPFAGHPPVATTGGAAGHRLLIAALVDGRLDVAFVRDRHRAGRAGAAVWRAGMAARGVSVQEQVAVDLPAGGGIDETDQAAV